MAFKYEVALVERIDYEGDIDSEVLELPELEQAAALAREWKKNARLCEYVEIRVTHWDV
jgi:hypothetical protein